MPNDTHLPKVGKASKKTRLVEILKTAILSGDLTSGQAIVESRVAREVGVGQGVLREALFELEYQGFVQRTPFSGTRVTTLSHQDAREIFDVRLLLEPVAFAQAGSHAGPSEIKELRELLAGTFEAVDALDLGCFLELQLTYRRRIWKLANNKYLQRCLEQIVPPLFALYRVQNMPIGMEPVAARTNVENQEATINALAQGDLKEVERLVISYLTDMKRAVERNLPKPQKD